MRLPNVERAAISPTKVTSYLLSVAHPLGRAKARFFQKFGFTPTEPRLLVKALLRHANEGDVVRVADTSHGRKFEVEGPLATPDGRAPMVRSVWIVDARDEVPRFVTVLPRVGRRG